MADEATTSITPALTPEDRADLAIAALCLHGHPYGFTQDDVKTLRRVVKWLGAESVFAPALSSLADRIEALLPPDGKGDATSDEDMCACGHIRRWHRPGAGCSARIHLLTRLDGAVLTRECGCFVFTPAKASLEDDDDGWGSSLIAPPRTIAE